MAAVNSGRSHLKHPVVQATCGLTATTRAHPWAFLICFGPFQGSEPEPDGQIASGREQPSSGRLSTSEKGSPIDAGGVSGSRSADPSEDPVESLLKSSIWFSDENGVWSMRIDLRQAMHVLRESELF